MFLLLTPFFVIRLQLFSEFALFFSHLLYYLFLLCYCLESLVKLLALALGFFKALALKLLQYFQSLVEGLHKLMPHFVG